MEAILQILEAAAHGDGRPTVVIAHTVKGKGVSFMEGHYFWHTRVIKPDEFAIAMADLGEPLPATEGDGR
jgi:transketolase